MADVAVNPNTCAECGFAKDSEEHIRGVGLHGHIRTTKAVADAERADVMKRAHDFADSIALDEARGVVERAGFVVTKAPAAKKEEAKT